MRALMHNFRWKSNRALRRALFFLWMVSVANIFFSTALSNFSLVQSGITAVHSGDSSGDSLLESLIHIIFASGNPNADLMDSMEDSTENTDLVSHQLCYLDVVKHLETRLHVHVGKMLPNAFPEMTTPPPEEGI